MHKEILTQNQTDFLPLLKEFKKEFYMVGETAVALQIGHRESIDFDLFKFGKLKTLEIKRTFGDKLPSEAILVERFYEFTFIVNEVKFTFYDFPYKINAEVDFEDIIKIPDLLTLSAMKAFALGKRAKWKDYVDLYFILKQYSLTEVIQKTEEIFKQEFNSKLFREQLNYYDDVSYQEPVNYKPGFKVSDKEIKETLTQIAIS